MLEAALRGDFDGGLEQDSQDGSVEYGGADSLHASANVQDTGSEGVAGPSVVHRTDAAREVVGGKQTE